MSFFNFIEKIKSYFSLYDEIVSIEECGINDVIDIEVTGNHLFYANGLLTHNSGAAGGYSGADIDMSNAAESAGIPATADAMVALYQLDGEREQGVINIKILKNRLGGYVGNTFKLAVNYDTLKMSNMNADDEMVDTEGVFMNSQYANDELLDGIDVDSKNEIKFKGGIEEI